jgi:hypothetical protein
MKNERRRKRIRMRPRRVVQGDVGVHAAPGYEDTTNYYLKYWEMYYENEYVLAKIKETVYEIDSMQTHIEKLNEMKK